MQLLSYTDMAQHTYPVTLIAPTGKEQDVLLRVAGDGVHLLTTDERVSTES